MAGASRNWKRQGKILLQSLCEQCGFDGILMWNFRPPELGENKFLLLLASNSVLIYFDSWRKHALLCSKGMDQTISSNLDGSQGLTEKKIIS